MGTVRGERPWDAVIVGAGSAGGVLAARLSEDPARSVLLLEAGPDLGIDPLGLPAPVRDAWDISPTGYDWALEAELGAVGRRSPVFAGRLVAGSSATNNTMALRGQPGDYDGWGLLGWDFDSLLPSFVRLERDRDFGDAAWHGEDGPVSIGRPLGRLGPVHAAFLSAAEHAGHAVAPDHNAPGVVGAGPTPFNEVDGVRQSTALAYLADARPRPNLTVAADTVVDRLQIEDGRASGVVLRDGSALTAAEVVLAAGTYGSPTLLLRSGIGPAAELHHAGVDVRADRPGVGANLHDHPLLRLRYRTTASPSGPPLQTLLTFGDGHGGREMQVFPSGPTASDDGTHELTLLVALLTPASRGHVRLDRDDPAAPPAIDVRLLNRHADARRLVASARTARALASTQPLGDHIDDELWPGAEVSTDADLDDAIGSELNVYQHPVGTCRMGAAEDPGAVVDVTGRVHGVSHLRVADASIIPTIPRANTNLTVLALAERLSALMTAHPTDEERAP